MDMGISLKFEQREEFLYCTASGAYSFENGCSMIRDLLAELARRGASKVLVDCLEIEGSPSMVERYGLAEFMAREQVDHLSEGKGFPRLAVLAKEPLVDPNRFSQLAATNRGVQTKTVEEMEDAMKWLGVAG
jgi:hypothetical protein